jgi:hypothetical protein
VGVSNDKFKELEARVEAMSDDEKADLLAKIGMAIGEIDMAESPDEVKKPASVTKLFGGGRHPSGAQYANRIDRISRSVRASECTAFIFVGVMGDGEVVSGSCWIPNEDSTGPMYPEAASLCATVASSAADVFAQDVWHTVHKSIRDEEGLND